jgi:hypothetical protein
MTETHYIRNRRPNAFNLRVGGRHSAETVGQANAAGVISVQLGRRGSRTDSAALSEKDFKDGQVQQALRKEKIEEISEESFMALAARPDQDDTYRDDDEPATKKRIERDPTTLEMPTDEAGQPVRNMETIVPEFMPEGLRHHRTPKTTREKREAVRKIMSPGLEYVEEPGSTEEELGTRKAAPKRKNTKKSQ